MFKPIKEAWASTSKKSPASPPLSPVYGMGSYDVDEELAIVTSDLYDSMKLVQSDFVSAEHYNPDAAYLPFRRYLVDWMSDVGEQFNLHQTTIHTSILYLDKIFREQNGAVSPHRQKWQLLATACITCASKYEEAEEDCPPIPELLEVTKLRSAGHTSLSFRDGECEVLEYLNWTLRAVCPLHVIGYYLSKGVTFEEDRWQGRKLIQKIPKYIKKYAEFFCNLTLQNYSFQKYDPTLLASAIVMASRVALNVEPKWRPELNVLSGYDEESITECFEHVFKYYEEQFPDHGNRSKSPKNVTDI